MEMVNQWDFAEFLKHFENVIECCPLATAIIWTERPFRTEADLARCFAKFLYELSSEAQDGVLRLYPELASKQDEKLTKHSEREHQSVGLRHLSESDEELFAELNVRYRLLTGFPFVVFVAELGNSSAILHELRRRVIHLMHESIDDHIVNEERKKCIKAVSSIAAKRIKDIIKNVCNAAASKPSTP